MENNENEFQNTTDGGNNYSQPNNDGWTQAPNNGYAANGQQAGGYVEPPQQGGQGLAIAGMVLGIISLVCCCSGWLALVLGIVGIVLSIISLVQHKPGKGMAIAGIICAGISIILIVILMIIGSSISPSDIKDLEKMLEELEKIENTGM